MTRATVRAVALAVAVAGLLLGLVAVQPARAAEARRVSGVSASDVGSDWFLLGGVTGNFGRNGTFSSVNPVPSARTS